MLKDPMRQPLLGLRGRGQLCFLTDRSTLTAGSAEDQSSDTGLRTREAMKKRFRISAHEVQSILFFFCVRIEPAWRNIHYSTVTLLARLRG